MSVTRTCDICGKEITGKETYYHIFSDDYCFDCVKNSIVRPEGAEGQLVISYPALPPGAPPVRIPEIKIVDSSDSASTAEEEPTRRRTSAVPLPDGLSLGQDSLDSAQTAEYLGVCKSMLSHYTKMLDIHPYRVGLKNYYTGDMVAVLEDRLKHRAGRGRKPAVYRTSILSKKEFETVREALCETATA